MQVFERSWPDGDDERRREIIRHLVDISEEEFIVEFQQVFAYCMNDPHPAVRIGSLEGLWDSTDLS